MKKNSWRLSSDLVAYFPSDASIKNRVYLASPERKSYKAAVQKGMETSVFSEVVVENNSFNLKIGEDLSIYVKCSEFPDPENYYEVGNFHRTTLGFPVIGEIITQVSNDKADFKDTEFEAVFSEDYPGDVYFMTTGMSEYKHAFEEMKRRMNCTLNKKVKKWIPGNRYDTLTNTYYFLGEFKGRKENELNSDFLGDSDMVPVYLCTSELKDEKKISDILKTRKFGETDGDIQVLYSLPSAVDSGVVLENDIKDIKDYQEDLINTTISKSIEASEYGYTNYLNPKFIFDILSVQLVDLSYSDSVRDRISDITKEMLLETILFSWNLNKNRPEIFIGDTNNIEKNAENLVRKFYQDFKSGNGMRNLYYSKLYGKLGIDMESLAKEVLLTCNPEDLIKEDLKSYLSYGSIFFKNHYTDVSTKLSKQRINSTNYKLEVVTLDDLFVNVPDLGSVLKDIVESARNNFGIGVKNFYDTNIGTKKSPKIYTTIEVTILDLIKHYGGVDKVPQLIVDEIISSKFWTLSVLIDKDGELK